MKVNTKKIADSTVDQGIASWINHLNQVRLDRFIAEQKAIAAEKAGKLAEQSDNYKAAIKTLEDTWESAKSLIRTPTGGMRGGIKGIHGFLAEIGEAGIGNAESQVSGNGEIYTWVNDNGPWDLIRKAVDSDAKTMIQQKFQAGTVDHMSLQALLNHLETYPDSLEVGGKYQIPKDHYEKFIRLMNITEEEADRLPTGTGEFSRKEWEYVRKFVSEKKIPVDRIEPSRLTYAEVQAGKFEETVENEKARIAEINGQKEQDIKDEAAGKNDEAYSRSKPGIKEGAKTTVISAGLEGGISFCSAVIRKRKSGKKIKDFNAEDWKEIAGESGKGTVKGGIRGASVYVLTNYTATPAAVATSLVTAGFGVAGQAKKLRKGECTETEFIENSETLCLETAVSALSSFAGEIIIPVPILGPIIGNAVGSVLYQIGKNALDKHEQELIEQYIASINKLDEKLDAEYKEYAAILDEDLTRFLNLISEAFSPDPKLAFEASVKLATAYGVDDRMILHNLNEVRAYFLD